MRGNEHKLHVWRFLLVTRGNFLTVKSVSHGSAVPRDVTDSPTLNKCETHQDKGLGILPRPCLYRRDWTR